jgi:hypothetical protein
MTDWWLSMLPIGYGVARTDDNTWRVVDEYGGTMLGEYPSVAQAISEFLLNEPEEQDNYRANYRVSRDGTMSVPLTPYEIEQQIIGFSDKVHLLAQEKMAKLRSIKQ